MDVKEDVVSASTYCGFFYGNLRFFFTLKKIFQCQVAKFERDTHWGVGGGDVIQTLICRATPAHNSRKRLGRSIVESLS